VGGGTAINLDVQRAAAHDRDMIIPLILGIVLLILMGLLRAVVAPLILLDTILVRSVLVTALNLDLGRWMWWPGRLARRPDARPATPEHEIPPVRTG
jgi:uncharacterized membrane protein YdfJ with MMPL/SSD domain